MTRVYVLNEDRQYGGAEVYTHFFARALVERNYTTTLLVHPEAAHWQRLDVQGLTVQTVASVEDIERLAPADALLINHSQPPLPWLERLKRRGNLVLVAHHVPGYVGAHRHYAEANLLLAVSRHILNGCAQHGLTNTYPLPLLGVGEVTHSTARNHDIRANEAYVWETRKARDWLLSKLYPLYWSRRPVQRFAKRPGITVGVVSRIAHIKQFHTLFELLAPVLARYEGVNLEIFGSGKYRLVRDLMGALRPLGPRVRYWGWQWDVAAIYPQLDYLMTGLPEREALGLNVIEAQFCGTPVLAPRAAPFTETILDGATGHLYRDPREDAGADFERVLRQITAGSPRLDPLQAQEHLAQFRFPAFADRVAAAVEYARTKLLRSNS